MDQRSLIENHTNLIADGWEIQVEMTDRTRNGKVINYALSNSRLCNSKFKVVLTYPIASETGKYELVSKNGLEVICKETYTSESVAQTALWKTCKHQTEGLNDAAT